MEPKKPFVCGLCAHADDCPARESHCDHCIEWFDGCDPETCGRFRFLDFTECGEFVFDPNKEVKDGDEQ